MTEHVELLALVKKLKKSGKPQVSRGIRTICRVEGPNRFYLQRESRSGITTFIVKEITKAEAQFLVEQGVELDFNSLPFDTDPADIVAVITEKFNDWRPTEIID